METILTLTQKDLIVNMSFIVGAIFLSFPLVIKALNPKKTKWGKFWAGWFGTLIITAILLTFVFLLPNIIPSTMDSIINFFKGLLS